MSKDKVPKHSLEQRVTDLETALLEVEIEVRALKIAFATPANLASTLGIDTNTLLASISKETE